MQNEDGIHFLKPLARTQFHFLKSCVIIVAFIFATSTLADTVEITLKDGTIWNGAIGETITVEYKEEVDGKELIYTGELDSVGNSYLVISEQIHLQVLFFAKIVSVKSNETRGIETENESDDVNQLKDEIVEPETQSEEAIDDNDVKDQSSKDSAQALIDPISLSEFMVLDDGTKIQFKFNSDFLWTTSFSEIKVNEINSYIDVLLDDEEKVDAEQPYFKSKSGKTIKISITSEDGPAQIITSMLGWGIRINRAPGIVKLRLQAGDTFKIVEIPVLDAGIKGATYDDIIDTHGIPDHDHDNYVSWPNDVFWDGIFYRTSDGVGISVHHLRWFSHPGLVVVFDGSQLVEITTEPERLSINTFLDGAKFFAYLYEDKSLSKKNLCQIPVAAQISFFRVLDRNNKSISFAGMKPDGSGYGKFWVPIDEVQCFGSECALGN